MLILDQHHSHKAYKFLRLAREHRVTALPPKDLSDPNLLRKCLDGFTQNSNESFNNIIWTYCPKNKYNGVKTLEISVGLAVISFNDGTEGWKSVFTGLKLKYGVFSKKFFRQADAERIKKAAIRATEASLEARRARRNARRGKDESDAKKDGTYGAGEH